MTTLNVKDKEKVRDPGKSESIKSESLAGEKRKFEEVFQSTKKEETVNKIPVFLEEYQRPAKKSTEFCHSFFG